MAPESPQLAPEPLNPDPRAVEEILGPDQMSEDWSYPKNAYHNTRVLCDRAGLTVGQKNVLCACIYQESQFRNYLPDGNPTKHENRSELGQLLSTDWGIVQVNDHYHIGVGKDFPSVDYVMAHPDLMVHWMIEKYRAGHLDQWSSYKTGVYKPWLQPDSPMWALGKA